MTESSHDQSLLLTVVLKNDQSKNLQEIRAHLDGGGWWEQFPPAGVEVVSWTVVIGLGQVILLRLPPSRLGSVYVELERSIWGLFPTECYATYDFEPIHHRIRDEERRVRPKEGS